MWQIVNPPPKKTKKQVKSVKVVNYNIIAANCYVLTMMQSMFVQYKQTKYRDLSTNITRGYSC